MIALGIARYPLAGVDDERIARAHWPRGARIASTGPSIASIRGPRGPRRILRRVRRHLEALGR
jgi:hypothetical protein